jgi:tRNA-Thr(GGU) m(6)t(6)A37 methyltransferase TsaA
MHESEERAYGFDVRPIGVVTRPGSDATPGAYFDPDEESVIVIDPIWESALTGIEEYSHLVVMFWLDRAERAESAPELFQPDGRADLPSVGLFATRTPRRPNPIGMACPRLIRRDGNRLVVRGIDAWDGTPVVDIKGYAPRDDIRADAHVPDWLIRLWKTHDEERVDRG